MSLGKWSSWWFSAGMRVNELASCKGRLEELAGEVFAPLARADQRVKGSLYLRGLLLDGRRKSMQPMAGRLGVDHQQLQQFMTSSTWPVDTVRTRLARRAVAVVRPQVWVVDDTGFPKDGMSSPGVARQYSGTLGKVGNCQIGVSVHAASDTASCPLSWRLFVPGSWDRPEAADHRARCRIPDGAHRRPKWQLALDTLGELSTVGLRPAVPGRGHRLRGERRLPPWPGSPRSGLCAAGQGRDDCPCRVGRAVSAALRRARAASAAPLPDPTGQPARTCPDCSTRQCGRGDLAQGLESCHVRPLRVPACPPRRPPPQTRPGR